MLDILASGGRCQTTSRWALSASRYVRDATVVALLIDDRQRAESPASVICLIAGSSIDTCCLPVGLSLKVNMGGQLKWAILLVWEAWGPQLLGIPKGLLPQMVSHLFIINLFALCRWFC